MAEQKDDIDDQQALKQDIREYIEKRVELITLTISEQLSLVVAHSVQRFLGMLILALAFFFLWFALSFYIGELTGSYSAGFAISSVPLFLAGFIFMKRKSKRLTETIQAGLIQKVIENFDKEKAKAKPGDNGKA